MSNSPEYTKSLAAAITRLKKHLKVLSNAEWNFAINLWTEVVLLESHEEYVSREDVYDDLEEHLSYPKRKIANYVQLLEFLENNGICEKVAVDCFPVHIAQRVHRSGLTIATKLRAMHLVHGWYETGSPKAKTVGVRQHVNKLKKIQKDTESTSDQKAKELENLRKSARHMLNRYSGNEHFEKYVAPGLRELLEKTKFQRGTK